MARAAAPAEHDNARLGLARSVAAIAVNGIGACQKTLGRRRDFGDLACHRAAGVRFSHRRPWISLMAERRLPPWRLQQLRGFVAVQSQADQHGASSRRRLPVRDSAPRRASGQLNDLALTMASARRRSLAFRARMSTISPR